MKRPASCAWPAILVAVLLGACAARDGASETDRLNVLLICVDDLRPELGCYGVGHASTPRLDAFASTARRFDRHYAAVPTCGASRAALLTGLLPTTHAHLGNDAVRLRAQEPGVRTLPETFRDAGYTTATLGKVMHWPADPDGSPSEIPGAWSDVLTFDSDPWGSNKDAFFAYADGSTRARGESPILEFPDVDDHAYPDARIAERAADAIRDFAARDEPFFFAVGFFKPHLPFNAPERYRSAYDAAPPRPPLHPERPTDLPTPNGWAQSGEVTGNYANAYWDDRAWSIDEQRESRSAYGACVSYVDAQIGRVLDALDESGLSGSTIVVVWGDHGWHLGELGLFGKHTPYEAALRSAFIVRAPSMTEPGAASEALISTVDLGATLLDLCALEPSAPTDGRSFGHILSLNAAAPHRDRVKSYWSRSGLIAVSERTEHQRLIEWRDGFGGTLAGVERDQLVAADHSAP